MWELQTLYTRDRLAVVDVWLPKFQPHAEVVIWGSRHFVWDGEFRAYVEGMAFWVPEQLVAAGGKSS